MGKGDEYRAKAIELTAKARTERDSGLRLELENLAKGYLRLADQAERNSQADIVYEPPLPFDQRADSLDDQAEGKRGSEAG